MGAYTCEYGFVHKVCRCPKPHDIKCDKVVEHSGTGYEPKHRAEPVIKYRITVIERERGWGSDEWSEDFDTEQEAMDRIKEINSKNTLPYVPDCHISAINKIERVQL